MSRSLTLSVAVVAMLGIVAAVVACGTTPPPTRIPTPVVWHLAESEQYGPTVELRNHALLDYIGPEPAEGRQQFVETLSYPVPSLMVSCRSLFQHRYIRMKWLAPLSIKESRVGERIGLAFAEIQAAMYWGGASSPEYGTWEIWDANYTVYDIEVADQAAAHFITRARSHDTVTVALTDDAGALHRATWSLAGLGPLLDEHADVCGETE